MWMRFPGSSGTPCSHRPELTQTEIFLYFGQRYRPFSAFRALGFAKLKQIFDNRKALLNGKKLLVWQHDEFFLAFLGQDFGMEFQHWVFPSTCTRLFDSEYDRLARCFLIVRAVNARLVAVNLINDSREELRGKCGPAKSFYRTLTNCVCGGRRARVRSQFLLGILDTMPYSHSADGIRGAQ
jgi:hypothetical protein